MAVVAEQSRLQASGAEGVIKGFGFVLFLGAVFIYLAFTVTEIQGAGKKAAPPGVNPERGEIVFWDQTQGICHRCHKIGNKGSMTRCPNLGEGDVGAPIFERAVERAAERQRQTGEEYTATDYLIESLATPGAYVVEGFPDKLMPLVYTGQSDLSAEDVMSVVSYLQSLSGDVDLPAIQTSMNKYGQAILNKKNAVEAVRAMSFAGPAWELLKYSTEKMETYRTLTREERRVFLEEELNDEEKADLEEEVADWVADGKEVFTLMKCWQCHQIKGENFGQLEEGKIGPDLTGLGDIQTYEYIRESVLNPNAIVVPPLKDHADEDGNTKMPPFEDSLTLKQLDRLIFYLARKTPPPEKKE